MSVTTEGQRSHISPTTPNRLRIGEIIKTFLTYKLYLVLLTNASKNWAFGADCARSFPWALSLSGAELYYRVHEVERSMLSLSPSQPVQVGSVQTVQTRVSSWRCDASAARSAGRPPRRTTRSDLTHSSWHINKVNSHKLIISRYETVTL